jgi:hypothetical protein
MQEDHKLEDISGKIAKPYFINKKSGSIAQMLEPFTDKQRP